MAMVVTFLGAAPAMAAEVRLGSSGDLTYEAAATVANSLTISGGGGSPITLSDPADPIAPGPCTAIDANTVSCDATGVSTLNVRLRDQNDVATNLTDLPSEINGNNGDDTIHGGSNWDMLRGSNGDDRLFGNAGNDILIGDGDSTLGADELVGGDGIDVASYTIADSVRIDLSASGPQETGDGVDTLSEIENVNGSTSREADHILGPALGNDTLIGDGGPNTLLGKGGDDEIRIRNGGSDAAGCGTGNDTVVLDRSDTLLDPTGCETVDDGVPPSVTTITSGPDGHTNDPKWGFTSDEPWADFECTVVDSADEIASGTWTPCVPGQAVSVPDGPHVFAVRAFDDQDNRAPWDMRSFTLDTVAPDSEIQGPSGTTSDSTPEFSVSSPDDPDATFVCGFDREAFFECSTPVFPDPPLSDGDHFLEVAAIDAAGNRDATPARVSFRVDTSVPPPGPRDGPAPNPQPQSPAPPQVQQAKIIIGSLVLISGRAVKMSRKGRISILLTCAGAARCTGRLSITTAEPVRKKSRKLVTLGAKKFAIAANKKRRVKVKFSKGKMRLAKRLKRFKAKALIREIDARGNPRISSRLFILRAR
jgi:hypothetical protein